MLHDRVHRFLRQGLLGSFDEVGYRLPLFGGVQGENGAVIGFDAVKTKKGGVAQG